MEAAILIKGCSKHKIIQLIIEIIFWIENDFILDKFLRNWDEQK